ncbi:hypothetical protein LEMLEM_LOCUS18935 [Lemmus lemmus]
MPSVAVSTSEPPARYEGGLREWLFYLHICLLYHMCSWCQRSQKRTLNLLELELAMRCHMMLGIKPESSKE